MSTAMVVMVLKLMMVVAKVLLLHLPPLQVHLQPLFSPSGAFLDEPCFFYGSKKCEVEDVGELCCSDGGGSTLLSPQHPASPTSGPTTGLTSPPRGQREASPRGSCRSANQYQSVDQLLFCGGCLENALPAKLYFITSHPMVASIHLFQRALRIPLLPSLVPAGGSQASYSGHPL